MNRRFAAWAALGLAAYVLFLFALMPASFVAERARVATNGAVQLTEASGPWWNGRARGRISPASAAPVELDALSWQLKPLRLFVGRVAFDVKASAVGLVADLEAARTLGGWQARDVNARADAAALATIAPLLSALRPTGAITLTAPRLEWDGTQLDGEATAEWRGATVGFSEVRPVGSYRASFEASGSTAKVGIVTLDGPLRITAQGAMQPTGRFNFTGEAKADSAQAVALEPLLAMLGTRRGDGAYGIDWRP
jgi:general secretion pathway protein N